MWLQRKRNRLRVFHAGLSLLVKSLESKGNGVFCKLQLPSRAERRLVFFHLAAYLGDNPEMSEVCLVYEVVKAQVPDTTTDFAPLIGCMRRSWCIRGKQGAQ